MAPNKNDQFEDVFTGDFNAEELNERRRIAAQARAANPDYKKRKKKRSFFQKYGVLLFLSSFILIMAGLITWVIEWPERRAIAASLSLQQAVADSAAALQTSASGPVRQTENYTVQSITPALATVRENGRVELSYFEDALILGDSLSQGFQTYENGLKSACHASYIGANPRTIVDNMSAQNNDRVYVNPHDDILPAQVSKIYVLFGTNALSSGQTDEAFLKYYNDMLDWLVANKPGCIVYLQSIPPVGANKSANDANFAKERIQNLNNQIAMIAWQRGMYYLDIASALSDENGDLNASFISGSDGIHLNNSGYGAWRAYLQTHTVYNANNKYIVGSPTFKV